MRASRPGAARPGAVLLMLLAACPARAQESLGLRAGVAVLTPPMVRRINASPGVLAGPGIPPSFPVMTQVGAERRFALGAADGATAELSFVGLAGAAERRAVVLSGHALVGIRSAGGLRAAVSPAVSLTDVGVAVALGRERRVGPRYHAGADALLELTTGGIRLSLLAGLIERQ